MIHSKKNLIILMLHGLSSTAYRYCIMFGDIEISELVTNNKINSINAVDNFIKDVISSAISVQCLFLLLQHVSRGLWKLFCKLQLFLIIGATSLLNNN